jgi:ubiquinone/menaquinone biosynthesis C-methylase UbiE
MTDEMIELALKNKEKMNVENVEFIKGYIEDIPLPDESVDVIISNCVINLSPDKEKTMREIYRVLKPGGRIAIGDMVAQNEIPHEFKEFLKSIWSGCIGGALSIGEFSSILENVGFREINISPVENSYLNPQVIKIKKSEIMGDTMGIEMNEEQLERFYEFLERISTEKVYLSARIMAVK